MRRLLISTAALAVLSAPAATEVRYDRKLEAAVMERVAQRMGAIRGSFEFGRTAAFPRIPDAMVTGSVDRKRPTLRGAIAFPSWPTNSGRKVSRVVF